MSKVSAEQLQLLAKFMAKYPCPTELKNNSKEYGHMLFFLCSMKPKGFERLEPKTIVDALNVTDIPFSRARSIAQGVRLMANEIVGKGQTENYLKTYFVNPSDDKMNLRNSATYTPRENTYTQQELDEALEEQSFEYKEKISSLTKRIGEFRRQKNYYEKRIHNNEYTGISDTVKKYVKEMLDKMDYMDTVPKYKVVGKKTMIVCISDQHTGMNETRATNVYNETVLQERYKELAGKVINDLQTYSCENLIVCFLGDVIAGSIHSDNFKKAPRGLAEATSQTIQAIKDATTFLQMIANYVPKIVIYGVSGNHDRIHKQTDENIESENHFCTFEFGLRQAIEILNMRYGEEKFVFPERDFRTNNKTNNFSGNTRQLFKLYGRTFLLTHGHLDSKKKAVANSQNLVDGGVDYILAGHFHSNYSHEEGSTEYIVSGSFCGTDEFAENHGYNSQPCQTCIILEEGTRDIITKKYYLEAGWYGKIVPKDIPEAV